MMDFAFPAASDRPAASAASVNTTDDEGGTCMKNNCNTTSAADSKMDNTSATKYVSSDGFEYYLNPDGTATLSNVPEGFLHSDQLHFPSMVDNLPVTSLDLKVYLPNSFKRHIEVFVPEGVRSIRGCYLCLGKDIEFHLPSSLQEKPDYLSVYFV